MIVFYFLKVYALYMNNKCFCDWPGNFGIYFIMGAQKRAAYRYNKSAWVLHSDIDMLNAGITYQSWNKNYICKSNLSR